jgi:mannose/fructose/N-acetylgalactosamine-specific phosphotransferase system component IIB
MSLDLLRIDERLIHGQVVVGWGTRLGLKYYLVVDDGLAESTWEQELYRSALPDGVTAEFLSTDDAIQRFHEFDSRSAPGALLTRGTATMRALAESGALQSRRVNVGGLHGGTGRKQLLDYLHLCPDERDDLSVIASHVDRVSARDLPTAPEVTLDHLGL